MEKVNKDISFKEAIRLLTQDREFSFNFSNSKTAEYEFQCHVVDCLPEIIELLKLPKIRQIKTQYVIGGIKAIKGKCIMDIVVFHMDNTISVFEVKFYRKEKGSNDQLRAVGQSLFYNIAIEERFGVDARIFIIDWHITPELFVTCANNRLMVNLLELNGDRLLVPYKRYEYKQKSTIHNEA